MHRRTPVDTSFRSYSAGGARAVVKEVDDTKQMQEATAFFMKEEKRKEIEAPQNYGFTSVTMDADQGGSGGGGEQEPQNEYDKIKDAAEAFITFVGGNRSFPVAYPIDDRRHRLKNLDKGDTAMFRLKDDQQQIHMTEDGTFISTREDKLFRVALVPKKQQQQSGGSGSGGSGQSGGGQQQQRGQESLVKDNQGENAKTFWEQNQDFYVIRRGNGWLVVTDQYVHIYNGSDGDKTTEPDKSSQGSHLYICDDHVHLYNDKGDKAHLYISKTEAAMSWGPTGDESISAKVDSSHAHLRYKGMTLWVNNGGCFSTVPMQTKADSDSGSQTPDPDPIKHQTSSSS